MRFARAPAILLLLPSTAYADGGGPLPGVHTVWIDYILTVEQDFPDYEFFLVFSTGWVPAEQLPTVTPSNPIRVSGSTDPFHMRAWIFVVRKSLLAGIGDKPPADGWFLEREGRGVERLEIFGRDQMLDFRKPLLFTDNREQAEIVCRIEKEPNGWRLVKVSENAGSWWVKWGWILAGVFSLVGITGLGFWTVKHICRRSSP